jgi:hypothetical protein
MQIEDSGMFALGNWFQVMWGLRNWDRILGWFYFLYSLKYTNKSGSN